MFSRQKWNVNNPESFSKAAYFIRKVLSQSIGKTGIAHGINSGYGSHLKANFWIFEFQGPIYIHRWPFCNSKCNKCSFLTFKKLGHFAHECTGNCSHSTYTQFHASVITLWKLSSVWQHDGCSRAPCILSWYRIKMVTLLPHLLENSY